MRISSGRKTLMLVGILVISGAAFVYFDPLGLDLLGLQQHAVVTKPAPAPHPSALAAKTTVAPVQAAASVAPSGAFSTASAPQAISPAHPPVIVQHAVVPATTPSTAVPVAPATAPAEVAQPTAPPAKPARTAMKAAPVKPRAPKDADLRHCLDLENDAAIAKCAGE